MARWILQFKISTERLIKEMSWPFGVRDYLYLFEVFLPIDIMQELDLKQFIFLLCNFIEEGLVKVFFNNWGLFHLCFVLEDDWLHLHFRLLRGADVSNWIIVLAEVTKAKYIGLTFSFFSLPWLCSHHDSWLLVIPIVYETRWFGSLVGHLEGVISCQIWNRLAFVILVRHFTKTWNRCPLWFPWTLIFSRMSENHLIVILTRIARNWLERIS